MNSNRISMQLISLGNTNIRLNDKTQTTQNSNSKFNKEIEIVKRLKLKRRQS